MVAHKPEVTNIISYLLKIDDNNSFRCIKLLNFFLDKYPDAPGSSGNHQAYPGGYYIHVNDILEYAIMLYKSLSKKDHLTFSLSDALLVLFLHDIEKPIKYSGQDNPETDAQIRSRLINEFGFELTNEHLLALKYIHGEGQDYRKDKRVMTPLCAFCHCCDVISARIFFK